MAFWSRRGRQAEVPAPEPVRNTVWVVRHGHEDRLADGSLSPMGRTHAQVVAFNLERDSELMDGRRIRVLCSPTLRTQQTAEIIALQLGVMPEPQEWLGMGYSNLVRVQLADESERDPGTHLVVVTHQSVIFAITGVYADPNTYAEIYRASL